MAPETAELSIAAMASKTEDLIVEKWAAKKAVLIDLTAGEKVVCSVCESAAQKRGGMIAMVCGS